MFIPGGLSLLQRGFWKELTGSGTLERRRGDVRTAVPGGAAGRSRGTRPPSGHIPTFIREKQPFGPILTTVWLQVLAVNSRNSSAGSRFRSGWNRCLSNIRKLTSHTTSAQVHQNKSPEAGARIHCHKTHFPNLCKANSHRYIIFHCSKIKCIYSLYSLFDFELKIKVNRVKVITFRMFYSCFTLQYRLHTQQKRLDFLTHFLK